MLSEREKLWQHVLSDRVRRNSINPVVLYTRHQNQIKREAPMVKEPNPAKELLAAAKRPSKEASPCTQLNVPRPTLSSAASPSAASSAVVVVNNGAVRSQVSKMACLPSTAHRRASSSEDDDLPAKVPKWNGIEEVMEAYQRYVKGIYISLQKLFHMVASWCYCHREIKLEFWSNLIYAKVLNYAAGYFCFNNLQGILNYEKCI